MANQKPTKNSAAVLANSASLSAETKVSVTKTEMVAASNDAATKATVVNATKTTTSTDVSLPSEVASFRKAYKMNNMEIPTAVREAVEKTTEQAQATYDKFKASAEEASNILEDSIETSRQGMVDLQEKVLDALKTNTEATFDFCISMLSVKSFSEALELQSGFARKQYETVASQGKDFQEFTTKLFNDVTLPAKEAGDKAFNELKAA